ncbi:hypothetical protein [Phenylobacterium aquaticum]|uniref:hypothetical protein n=1 Tax=Phenylobacterium aquaticum TaxID=1763816 RepID=UPI001F5E1BDA|nr:hypothetical protein [Phenylobacterium aquaticum]MCI3132894.1 hypothetical protein [Phenylobacterium aquaticum]
MSLFDPARRLWRRLAPSGLRNGAQPLLGRLLEAQVRKAAAAPHEAQSWRGPVRVVGWFEASHGIAASARQAARAFEALGVPVERVDVTGARLDWLPPPQPKLPAAPGSSTSIRRRWSRPWRNSIPAVCRARAMATGPGSCPRRRRHG